MKDIYQIQSTNNSMSDPQTFLGQPEIFWSAMEAIGTVLVVILALGIRGKISKWLISPRLKISNIKYYSIPKIDDANAEVHISFKIKNKPLIGKRGKAILGLTYSAWATAHTGESVFEIKHNKNENLFIPAGRSIGFTHTVESIFDPDEKYELILRFETNDTEIARKRISFKYEPLPLSEKQER